MRRLLALLPLVAGCYDFDALSRGYNIVGQYTVNVTNGRNGCMFGMWTEGNTSQGIPLGISANGTSVVASIGGLVGTFINFYCGANDLVGTASGSSSLDVSLECPKTSMQSTCTFHVLAHAEATVSGDVIMGTIQYTAIMTNGDPACAPLQGCQSIQQFNGTRPPH